MSQLRPKSKSISSSLDVEELELEGEEGDFYIDPITEKKLLRKLDLRLIPWLCLLYLISFLDRTNVGNAYIAGYH
jgi:MFS transporter, ACS family, DAL5 transporter family protein